MDFNEYVAKTCFSLSPPEDPGCACTLPKGHLGKHRCGGCDTEWEWWDETGLDWSTYGEDRCNPETGYHSTPHRGCILR